MLQAHSLLWHYLWLAPNVLLLTLAFLIWKNGLQRTFPAFFAFALLNPLCQFALYIADVAPSITAENFWRIDWATLLIAGPLKFAVVAEIFARVFGSYDSLARLGRLLIRGVGIVLALAAAVAAAYAAKDSLFEIIAGAHLLEQTIALITTGLLLFIFVFAAYFKLRPARPILGIALGLAISSCTHLAIWALAENAGLSPERRVILDFVGMASSHIAVLAWLYYLIVPRDVATKPVIPLPENNLDLWNRELERLVHQ
jgi:hypothetical protein